MEPGTSPELVVFLDKMRFMLRVEVADLTDGYAVVSVADAARHTPPPGAILVGDDVLLPRELLAERLGGLRLAGLWAYEALRIEGHRPRLGFETDHKTIPHEVGWIGPALHLSKGCYKGQETVARVHNLGHPRAAWSSCTWTAASTRCPDTVPR